MSKYPQLQLHMLPHIPRHSEAGMLASLTSPEPGLSPRLFPCPGVTGGGEAPWLFSAPVMPGTNPQVLASCASRAGQLLPPAASFTPPSHLNTGRHSLLT